MSISSRFYFFSLMSFSSYVYLIIGLASHQWLNKGAHFLGHWIVIEEKDHRHSKSTNQFSLWFKHKRYVFCSCYSYLLNKHLILKKFVTSAKLEALIVVFSPVYYVHISVPRTNTFLTKKIIIISLKPYNIAKMRPR